MEFIQTNEEIIDLCNLYKIRKYKINDDLSIDVNYDVNINHKNLTKIPLNFRHVAGGFYCYSNELTNLIGSPLSVGGEFKCHHNELYTLEGLHIFEKLTYSYNPICNLVDKLQPITLNIKTDPWSQTNFKLKELTERLEEFEVIKNVSMIDLTSLENLFDYYEVKFNPDRYKNIQGYEIY